MLLCRIVWYQYQSFVFEIAMVNKQPIYDVLEAIIYIDSQG